MSDVVRSGCDGCSAGLSTRDRVYGSQVLPCISLLLDDRTSAVEFGLGGGGAHTWVAAFAAAGGGRVLSVVAIFPDAFCSFGPDRSVFNMPVDVFSGLGVLVRGLAAFAFGGVSLGDVGDCWLFDRVISSPELFVLIIEGRGGGAGRRTGVGEGRGISA